MQSLFRSFFTVSFYTLLSRILGFVRDILIARFLGSTVTSDAFFVAFRIPNFFRRVLAEGAYSAALVPVFSGIVIDSRDDYEAADFVENTMSLLLFVTVGLTIIFFFGMSYIIQILAPGFPVNSEAFDLAVYFGKIIFPYLIFISLAAHFTSILNVHERFAAGAFAPAILNISFILSLYIITPYVSSAGHALSIGVLIGGIGQFLFLYRSTLYFYKPKLKFPELNERLRKFFRLFIPGVIGSGVIQLNIIIGTIIASFLPIGAISHLYYADRVNQLPLGIFGIALGVVLLPGLSKAIKSDNNEMTKKLQNRSLEFALLISIPSAIGLYILSLPIVHILFERGAFTKEDTLYTSNVLGYFTLGLPAYVLIKVFVICFFAREDTKTPLYISIVSVITNIILSLLLISTMREMGIALATALSAWLNAFLLFIILIIKKTLNLDRQFLRNIIKLFISLLGLFFIIQYLESFFFADLYLVDFINNIFYLLLTIIIAAAIYGILIFILKIITINDIKNYLKK
ncbi:murein biosynthesis integral membrane protein MurJ [Pelagibacteraceae bacterium]|nr:murein biosynthesis integral membrane protein MurJ [Pelagibacteraceae bacterium]